LNVKDYLNRIGYTQDVQVNRDSLLGLQYSHLLAVPFENLDIALNRPIQLDEKSLWRKIVIRRRGGFCYELNGLFAWLLKEIGFEVTYLNARHYFEEDDRFGVDFDHLAMLVRIPAESERWLVDVGYGDSFISPINLDASSEHVEGINIYQIEPFKDGYQLWRRSFDGSRSRLYFFDLTAHNFPSEYEAACHYHQTSPRSTFTQKRIISRLTENGRVTLDDNKLIITKNGSREEFPSTEEERTALLKEHFGVVI
jgi:N-hydroxyarylamine O-acetyltransferase